MGSGPKGMTLYESVLREPLIVGSPNQVTGGLCVARKNPAAGGLLCGNR
jgi:hypothetical protein